MFNSCRRFLEHLQLPRVEVRLDFSPDMGAGPGSRGEMDTGRVGCPRTVDLAAVRAARLASRELPVDALVAMDR